MRYKTYKSKCKTAIRIYEGENANEANEKFSRTRDVLDRWPIQDEENYK